MRKAFFYTAFVIAIAFSSCDDFGERVNGNGNIKRVERDISKSSKIRVLGSIDVFVSSGPASVAVEADENIIPYIITEVEDNWLEVKTKDHVNLHTNNSIKVYVSTPNISDLRVSGSGNITCNNKFVSNKDISFKITGSGDIKAMVNAPVVDADITGSGNLQISGETRDVEISVTGSGNFDGGDLKAENAVVKIAGSGDARLFADGNLKATISGSGDIRYSGNASVNKHIAGSGTVTKVN